MTINSKKIFIMLFSAVLVIMLSGLSMAGDDVTIVGTVNEDNQIVDDKGMVYELAENEMAGKVLENTGKKVEVKGTVMEGEGGGMKTITITSFKVME